MVIHVKLGFPPLPLSRPVIMTLCREKGGGDLGWLGLYFVHRAYFLFEGSPILEWFVGSWCGKVGAGTFPTVETLFSIFKISPPTHPGNPENWSGAFKMPESLTLSAFS